MTHKYLEKSSITCRVEYSIQILGLLERYALGAFIGVKPRDQLFGYAVCVIVKCRTPNIQDCGSPIEGYSSNTLFNSLHIYLVGHFQMTLTCMLVHLVVD